LRIRVPQLCGQGGYTPWCGSWLLVHCEQICRRCHGGHVVLDASSARAETNYNGHYCTIAVYLSKRLKFSITLNDTLDLCLPLYRLLMSVLAEQVLTMLLSLLIILDTVLQQL
jgi:hypothetical protein